MALQRGHSHGGNAKFIATWFAAGTTLELTGVRFSVSGLTR
ncbi:hypothetical protein ACFQ0G_27465 [Streptomyces chiangmaiensis]|uniref:Uncharacterized protein n=1 Tax=Streptomyces chiangmaiensis TaxID=766497 RepID=A0ABU7FVW3_9ACTN|nr:hypothetical protein [Streptomyces chiangmaiensis]